MTHKLAKESDFRVQKNGVTSEMPNGGEAERAIQELNGKEFMERELTVNEARPRRERGRGDNR